MFLYTLFFYSRPKHCVIFILLQLRFKQIFDTKVWKFPIFLGKLLIFSANSKNKAYKQRIFQQACWPWFIIKNPATMLQFTNRQPKSIKLQENDITTNSHNTNCKQLVPNPVQIESSKLASQVNKKFRPLLTNVNF